MNGDLVARIHFAGTTRLTSDPAAVKLNQLAALPETAQLREMVLQKLSTAPFRLFQNKLANGNTNDFSWLLRPLVDDLMREESYVEMRGPSNAIPELMLAVHLNSTRAKAWHDSLSKVLSTWTGIPVKEIQGDGFSGWELRKHHDPNLIRCLRAGDWVLFGWGQDELRLQPAFLQRIKTQKRPVEDFKEGFLDASVDLQTLMRYHPFSLLALFPSPLPKVHLTEMMRKDYVRSKLVMQFPEPLNLKLDPWKIPTNTIHNPIVNFTAVRGVASWLGRLEVVKKTQPPSVPNQLCFWSMPKLTFDIGMTAPVSDAGKYMAQIGPRLAPALDSYFNEHALLGKAEWTNHQVRLSKLPFIAPYLAPTRDAKSDFLLGSLMPVRHTNSLVFPPELMRELLSKPNLVYYGWEINEESVVQWQALQQIYLMDAVKPLPS
ncbi:MAG TPA: hypothetical protein VG754_03645, partial [Verrucomicrobiae bacterium]|nr:hypothetical protein [Verrucomicrobiae bacterium]